MKHTLNFVLVVETKEEKHFAYAEKVLVNQNLAHYCDKQEGYDDSRIIIMHYCDTYKEAENLASIWNASYKAQGKLAY